MTNITGEMFIRSSGDNSARHGNMSPYYSSSSPFTEDQWHELETQALIYKYLNSGLPIPPNIISSLRTSQPPSTSMMQVVQPPPALMQSAPGWGCFQEGCRTRKLDTEPGRCRRTDGKKWRCSKEAYPDSKYCEKHMHRGKNRARKAEKADPLKQPLPTAPVEATSNISLSRKEMNSDIRTNSNYQMIYPFFMAVEHDSSSSYQSSQPGSTLPRSYLSTPSQDVIANSRFTGSRDEENSTRHYHGQMTNIGLEKIIEESPRTDDGTGSSQQSYKSGYSALHGQAKVETKSESSHRAAGQDYKHQQRLVSSDDFKTQSSSQTAIEKEREVEKPMLHFFGKQ